MKPLPLKLDDEKSERVRRTHEAAILELQTDVKRTIIAGVDLANGVATTIVHRLGRVPALVSISVPRGAVSAGYVVETHAGVDRKQALVLTASGYGATITVDVEVT